MDSRNGNGRVVEMFGLPGVGKSWICERLADSAGELPLNLRNGADELSPLKRNGRKYLGALRFLYVHPLVCVRLLRLAIRGWKSGLLVKLRKLVNLFAELNSVVRHTNTDLLVNEQGVLQGVWSLIVASGESTADSYLNVVSPWLPDVVVYVVVSEMEVHAQQLQGRETNLSRFDGLSVQALGDFRVKGEQRLLEILSATIALNSDCKLVIYEKRAGVSAHQCGRGVGDSREIPSDVVVHNPEQLATALRDMS